MNSLLCVAKISTLLSGKALTFPMSSFLGEVQMDNKAQLWERFQRYVAITTQSDPKAQTVPSTPGQFELANLLASELKEMGFVDVEVSEHAVVTSKLPSNLPAGQTAKAVGWVVHMDTVNVGLSPDIHPQMIKNYQGGDICLNKDQGIFLKTSEHPEIEQYVGDDIVVSDGTSVLGADDKSAIANVMTAMDIITKEGRAHGDIYICFVPDEELGEKGARKIDFSKFPVDFAYTIDCCALGEVVWETFNAGSASLFVKGVTAHPMSSKGVLVNPILVVHDFINMLDRGATPEFTENREGFIVLKTLEAKPSQALLTLKIRDHNKKLYEEKKAMLLKAVEFLKIRHPKAEITYEQTDVYANIADSIRDDNRVGIDHIYRALDLIGVEAKTSAMRGGTDGSFISTKGILTPNYFTGAHNFHSNCEFLPMNSWEKSLQVTLTLVDLIAGTKA